ncbi:site-specific integrase [Sinorhizobium meliloti]|uniref:tyrosine-type recombinase/integrase n=1 Tax=Rhizobium meliloti TaxID=382 RepID=UPI000FDBB56F|nr:site-specific integrase [Sinorhizobium meliloti]RVN00454.1 site-specific integrase [Sinorhizobium meliloti]
MTKAKLEAEKVGPFRVAPRIRDGAHTGAWIVDVPPHLSPNGKRARHTLPTKAEALAEAKRMLRELQLDGALSGRGFAPKVSGVTLAEVSKRWLEEQADRVATGKKRQSSLDADGFKLKAILGKFPDTDVSSIGTKEMATYQKHRVEAGCVAATINAETSLFLQVLRWAQEKSLVEKLPKVERIPVPVKRVDVPTPEEMSCILDALGEHRALLVRFLAETGVRKTEAYTLEWSDLDTANQLVSIRRKDGFTPKTRHSDRDIPISASLCEALSAAKRAVRAKAMKVGDTPPLLIFPGRFGGKLVNIRRALASAVKKAGVKRNGQPLKLTPHVLRKAMATWLHVRGVPDALLQPRLGHAPGSRVTKSVYVNVTTEDMRASVIDLEAERRARLGAAEVVKTA